VAQKGNQQLMTSPRTRFSVLMPVYAGDHPEYFKAALESVFTQSRLADEVVVVKDGPLTDDLESVLKTFESFPLKVISRPVNGGLSAALNTGLNACQYEYIARMDADDVALPHRFERQMQYLEKHPQIGILGSWIAEYDEALSKGFGLRKVPETHPEIIRYARWRCPFNHMTVIYKREAVLACGGYENFGAVGDDYVLWVRFIQQGYQTANIQEVLVNARAGSQFFDKRRRGWRYFKQELREIRYMYTTNFINFPLYLFHFGIKAITRLSPPFIVRGIYWLMRR
jgi:glycosyltransferase involved in cell wall biosynthesis